MTRLQYLQKACHLASSLEEVCVSGVWHEGISSSRSRRQRLVPRTQSLVAITLRHHLSRSCTCLAAMTTKDHVTAAGCDATVHGWGRGWGWPWLKFFSSATTCAKVRRPSTNRQNMFRCELEQTCFHLDFFCLAALEKKKKIGVKCLMGVAKI